MKKKIGVLLTVVLCLNILSVTVPFANDNIYEKHYQVELTDLDLSIADDTISISKKDVPIYRIIERNNNAKTLENMLQDKLFERDLKKMIRAGMTPITIGVAEAEFIKISDDKGNVISSRPMTNREVAQEKNSNVVNAQNGQTQYRDRLALYTSISGTSPTYWVQSNATWSRGEYSSGNEALGVTWEGYFGANNNTSTDIMYRFISGTASLEDFKPYQGAVWSFHDANLGPGGQTNYLDGAYVGASITRTSGSAARHYFTSEYVHTFTSYTWEATVEFDSNNAYTGSSITLTPYKDAWKLQSYVVGTF